MAIKVGINGFGRIGRCVFRAAVENFAGVLEVEVIGGGHHSTKPPARRAAS